jgi:peptidoglycan/xylan/chitin deacetylase (PgdA/CDA1 family)
VNSSHFKASQQSLRPVASVRVPANQSLIKITLRSQIAGVRRSALCLLARRDAELPSERPLISFTFDDFPRTALAVGGALLRDAGLRGTFYVAPALIDTVNHLGPQFQRVDLSNLLQDGHELASHTYSHVSARAVSVSAYSQEVDKGFRSLAEEFPLRASRHFAYPFGDITLRVKQRVASSMQSCRGIYPGLNGPRIDLNLLRANSLYGDIGQFAAARTLIEENCKNKSWLIFYTHDIQSNPSPYGCTADLFEKVVCFAVESGARILPVGEVVALARG